MQDARYKTQDTGDKEEHQAPERQDTRYKMQDTGCK